MCPLFVCHICVSYDHDIAIQKQISNGSQVFEGRRARNRGSTNKMCNTEKAQVVSHILFPQLVLEMGGKALVKRFISQYVVNAFKKIEIRPGNFQNCAGAPSKFTKIEYLARR